MVDLSKFVNLPDAIEQEIIERELDDLLSKYWSSTDSAVLECIYELAIRQANNFSLIDEKLRMKLSEYLLKVWDKDSVENTESCLAIIVNFGLQSAYEQILFKAPTLSNKKVRMEIEDTVRDVGYQIEAMGF